ncbi:hypothetical protein ACKC4X_21100, partial [Aeromonas veronii]
GFCLLTHRFSFKKTRFFLNWAGVNYSLFYAFAAGLRAGGVLVVPLVGAVCVFQNTDYEVLVQNENNRDFICF